MGATPTKISRKGSTNNASRRSFEKPNSKPEINIYKNLLSLKDEIDQFNGTKTDKQFKIYVQSLTTYSKVLQDIKSRTTKQDRHNDVDKSLQIINSCFMILHVNKENERNLDQAAVESHSFINGSNSLTNLSRGRRNQRSWRKLESIQKNIRNIESEVSKAIEIEDMGKFKFLEEKIKLLLTDVEAIPSGGDESVFDKKEHYTNKLLSTFKKMKSSERKLYRNSKEIIDARSSMNNSQIQAARQTITNIDFDEGNCEIMKGIENKLSDLEVKILEFEGTSKDDNYKDLHEHLILLADQINEMVNTSSNVKQMQDKTLNIIEKLLNKTKRKALKNESILQNELKNIADIEDEVLRLEQKIKVFKGKQTDQDYKIIDQGLRKQWDILSVVVKASPTVKSYKSRTINKIKDNLKTLHDKSIQREAQSIFDTAESQNILEQTNKFEMHWNIIECSIDSTGHATNDLLLALTKLEAINQTINRKCKEIQSKVRVKDEIKFDIHPGTYGTINEKDFKIQDAVPVASPPAIARPTSVGYSSTLLNSSAIANKIDVISTTSADNYPTIVTTSPISSNVAVTSTTSVGYSPTILSTSDIANNAVSVDTVDKKQILDGPPVDRSIKPMSSVDIYSKIKSIIQDTASINVTINEFHGTSKTQKYHEIYMLLTERQECLQTIDDLGLPSLKSTKDQANAKIQEAFERLEKTVSENESVEETAKQRPQDEIVKITKQMKMLRKRVDCYSGHYKDADYVEIENGLQECWGQLKAVSIGSNANLQAAKNMTEEKICRYLQNLDERSIKIMATEV